MTQELVMQMTAEQAEAFARLNAAAEAGNGSAACRLGDMYREGTGGLRRSPKQAYRCYSRSALAGDARGQNNLGACYEHGIGVAQSYARAAKWYRRAAAQGLGTANMNLGYCYMKGRAVAADGAEALRLFRLAVKQGEPKAADELKRLGETVDDDRTVLMSGTEYADRTEPGGQISIVGYGGATTRTIVRAENSTVPSAGQKNMNPEYVSLGQLLPGFERLVRRGDMDRLRAAFDRFRRRTRDNPFIIVIFRRSIDIDAWPSDSIKIGDAFSREEDAATEAQRIHDEICASFLAYVPPMDFPGWEVVDHGMPAVAGKREPSSEPEFQMKTIRACMTKLKRSWYDIEYVCVFVLELPQDEDPVRMLMGESRFRDYRYELLRAFEDKGRAGDASLDGPLR